MSIRGVWIFKLVASKDRVVVEVLLSRRFPTVERRARIRDGASYIKLPADMDVCQELARELQLMRTSYEFIKEFDTASLMKRLPIFTIQGRNLSLVVIQKFGMVYAALPDLPSSIETEEKFTLPYQGGFAMAYTLMHNIAELTPALPDLSADTIFEIEQYLAVALPLGTPVEMSVATVRSLISGKDSAAPPKQKLPAWKPNSGLKSRSTLSLIVKEQLRSIEFNSDGQVSLSEVFGTLHCKADVDGSPEITLFLLASPQFGIMDQLVFHPCVQLVDTVSSALDDRESSFNAALATKQLRFRPGPDNCPLLHYRGTVRDKDGMPVLAYFKMKEESPQAVKVLLQVRFNRNVKNSLEVCDLQIPFEGRGEVRKVDYHPKSANVLISQDKRTLLWGIGSKSIPKSLELSLEAQIEFSSKDVETFKAFTVEQASFAKLNYKIKDYTLSGIRVDSKATHFYPQMKVNVSSGVDFSTYDVKIWNSNAKVDHIPNKPLQF